MEGASQPVTESEISTKENLGETDWNTAGKI